MLRRTTILLVALAALSTVSVAQSDTDVDYGELIMHYFEDPAPQHIAGAMEWFAAAGMLRNETTVAPVTGFLAEVFARNPDRMAEWQTVIDAQASADRKTLEHAVALSADPVTSIAAEPATIPRNDMFWGAFFASGDTAYVDLLITSLPDYHEREDMERFTIASSAKWSLASNARNYPTVRAALERARETATGVLAEQLDDVLTLPPGKIRDATVAVIRQQANAGKW